MLKWLYAPLALLGPLAVTGGPVLAASPEFCTLYAQEYADQHRGEANQILSAAMIRDRAYYKCLNQDDEPALPAAQATAEPAKPDKAAAIAPARPAAPTKTATTPEALTPPVAIAYADEPPPVPRKKGRFRGSGFPQGSKEWVAWCAAHYRSFDPATGTYQPFSGPKTLCR
jgi:hypothetical protein